MEAGLKKPLQGPRKGKQMTKEILISRYEISLMRLLQVKHTDDSRSHANDLMEGDAQSKAIIWDSYILKMYIHLFI